MLGVVNGDRSTESGFLIDEIAVPALEQFLGSVAGLAPRPPCPG